MSVMVDELLGVQPHSFAFFFFPPRKKKKILKEQRKQRERVELKMTSLVCPSLTMVIPACSPSRLSRGPRCEAGAAQAPRATVIGQTWACGWQA